MLIDETALLLQPLWRRGWAPRGQPPSVRSTARKARWTLIGALTVSPRRQRMGLYFQAIAGNANAELFVHFLLQLQRSLGKPLLVIWDGLPSHKKAARLLQQRFAERFRFETLPPYSPQLNPVEWLWSELKWNHLHSPPPLATCKTSERAPRTAWSRWAPSSTCSAPSSTAPTYPWSSIRRCEGQ